MVVWSTSEVGTPPTCAKQARLSCYVSAAGIRFLCLVHVQGTCNPRTNDSPIFDINLWSELCHTLNVLMNIECLNACATQFAKFKIVFCGCGQGMWASTTFHASDTSLGFCMRGKEATARLPTSACPINILHDTLDFVLTFCKDTRDSGTNRAP